MTYDTKEAQRQAVVELKARAYDELHAWIRTMSHHQPDPSALSWKSAYDLLLQADAKSRKDLDRLIDSFPE